MLLNGTTKSRHFWIFILLLSKFLESWWKNYDVYPKVVFDNARIHLTAEVTKLWSYLNLEINTLPPYTPHLAPVEAAFEISKKRIQSNNREKSVYFGKPSGKRAVLKSLKPIDMEMWCKLWKRFIRNAKEWISDAYESASLQRTLLTHHLNKESEERIERLLLEND